MNQPEGIATDGTHIWILDKKAKQVLRYDDAAVNGDSTPDFSFTLAGGNGGATGITTDGTSIWVVDDGRRTDQVFKYSVADGTLLGSWTIDAANSKPSGITNDPSGSSTSIWIVDSGSDQVFEYGNGLADSGGSLTNVFALATANSNPQGIADPLPTNSLMGRRPLIETPPTLIRGGRNSPIDPNRRVAMRFLWTATWWNSLRRRGAKSDG